MKQWLAGLILAGSISGHAWGETGKCYLSINHKVYIDRLCNIVRQSDGSFEIGTKETPVQYFAIVVRVDRRALGFWNGAPGVRRAEQSLGWLNRNGNCWFGVAVKLCAVEVTHARVSAFRGLDRAED